MKRKILTIALTAFFLLNGITLAFAQEAPKPQKDTVNIDTDAKPQFYYAVEDEKTAGKSNGKSSTVTIIIIAGAAVVVGAGVAFLLKKKK